MDETSTRGDVSVTAETPSTSLWTWTDEAREAAFQAVEPALRELNQRVNQPWLDQPERQVIADAVLDALAPHVAGILAAREESHSLAHAVQRLTAWTTAPPRSYGSYGDAQQDVSLILQSIMGPADG